MTPNILVADIHDYFDRIAELVHGTVRTRSWEQQLSPPPHIGKGKITRMRIRPGMEIVVSDMTYERNMKLHIMEACRLFELSYCVSGEIYCEWDGKENWTGSRTGNVLFLENIRVYEEMKAGLRQQLLEVRFAPEELLRYADDAIEKHGMEAWMKRHKGSIDPYSDSPAIRKCVSDLIHCTYKGSMKRLYMEGKAMELLALFAEAGGRGPIDGKLVLRRDDIEKLKEVRQWVISRAEHPLSIRELARLAGINEFKLKKGFRELFGTTIFELVRQERMERALRFMEVERMNVGEAAVAVGYSNVSNFTTAFRKHYGCNPGEYVRQLHHLDLRQSIEQENNNG
ncbi:AraC family transcriptional regulator [Paenibacillus elgii]|uniref:AraC family transcriptional regulator n=1 Tax=Paenibacillus elgii TaxID=189691 RepID=A0A2T6FXW3_9BACL|nr:AraC family transcriptional regulator [Paenibacillus elgii]PUA36742.1 AraC family transcriptional regulator [Paenibacillus elgii]